LCSRRGIGFVFTTMQSYEVLEHVYGCLVPHAQYGCFLCVHVALSLDLRGAVVSILSLKPWRRSDRFGRSYHLSDHMACVRGRSAVGFVAGEWPNFWPPVTKIFAFWPSCALRQRKLLEAGTPSPSTFRTFVRFSNFLGDSRFGLMPPMCSSRHFAGVPIAGACSERVHAVMQLRPQFVCMSTHICIFQ
jgi:hypothetical protein